MPSDTRRGEEKRSEEDKGAIPWVLIFSVCFLIFCLIMLWVWYWTYVESAFNTIGGGFLESVAQFGDAFGFLNSIFSALALVGVAVAIVFQKIELDETRRELTRSANAHADTVEILQRNQIDLELQRMRAATPTLVWHGATPIAMPEHGIRWIAHNHGETIFSPHIVVHGYRENVDVNFVGSTIVPKEGKVWIDLISKKASIIPNTLEPFYFEIHCFDICGGERIQTFYCNPAKGCGIDCVDPDIGIPEAQRTVLRAKELPPLDRADIKLPPSEPP